MDNTKIAAEAAELAESVGWQVNETHMASTGSIYMELQRDREWVIVRVADHKQVYHHWLTAYSIAPGDLWFEDLERILVQPYGEVGDVL